MRRNKFNIGSRVKTSNGDEFQVISISEQAVNDMFKDPRYIDFGTTLEYRYRLKSVSDNSIKYFNESDLELIPKTEQEILMEQFSGYINQGEQTPKYNVGDVVTIPESSPTAKYIIKDAVCLGNPYGIVYEIFSERNQELLIQYAEDDIKFEYHDVSWEYHLESYENGLPLWRGKLYNFYSCYVDIDRHGSLDEATVKEYKDHTVPPDRMQHILRSHSIYDRIFDVIGNYRNESTSENRDTMMKKLNMTDNELTAMTETIQNKINARNKNDLNPKNADKADRKVHPTFTDDEYRFIDEIDKLDISKKKYKDHYPVNLTNLQIMDAIKDAYNNGSKAGPRKIQHDDDNTSLAAPTRGKMKYQGHSRKYDMDIEFWYNFDLDIIETAYPIRMNTNPKKH